MLHRQGDERAPSGNILRSSIYPDVHYIGEKMFELIEQNPDKKILFLITACEMTLEMFGDWGTCSASEGSACASMGGSAIP